MSHTWSPEVAMTREEINRFLDEKLVARIATHRADGTIHITPVYYFWDGEYLWFELGKGLRPRQHITNLKHDPTISIIIDRDIRPQVGSPKPGAQGYRFVEGLSSSKMRKLRLKLRRERCSATLATRA